MVKPQMTAKMCWEEAAGECKEILEGMTRSLRMEGEEEGGEDIAWCVMEAARREVVAVRSILLALRGVEIGSIFESIIHVRKLQVALGPLADNNQPSLSTMSNISPLQRWLRDALDHIVAKISFYFSSNPELCPLAIVPRPMPPSQGQDEGNILPAPRRDNFPASAVSIFLQKFGSTMNCSIAVTVVRRRSESEGEEEDHGNLDAMTGGKTDGNGAGGGHRATPAAPNDDATARRSVDACLRRFPYVYANWTPFSDVPKDVDGPWFTHAWPSLAEVLACEYEHGSTVTFALSYRDVPDGSPAAPMAVVAPSASPENLSGAPPAPLPPSSRPAKMKEFSLLPAVLPATAPIQPAAPFLRLLPGPVPRGAAGPAALA
eukprot:CAMPEP_0113299828 /NCGR_PEP_ID=MMETSP0010_2-20120614/1703_1 /TAXON_ID=216773 ORGANISM="Corethron hystrix, Strain 308" /NCGR_SAMPLE_ID=MMETSP0010_2 /ASSEMBLY_ACC=CAM_ASM_000155 /LENGTH=374 /DNA_ID=CAMNT_0000153133 /DNA_START=42 /DNA_END=1162 /DNA_ORIENTATION=- /assembly_acc=CAM_ASM_000155